MNIWQINNEIREFLESNVDPETGEILNLEGLAELRLKREEKLESIALTVKNFRAEAEAVKSEKLALAERQSRLEKNADRLAQLLSDELQGQKFATAKVECGFRRSKSTEILDLDKLPSEYIEFSPKPRKAEIKSAILAGADVPGAQIVEKVSIVIK